MPEDSDPTPFGFKNWDDFQDCAKKRLYILARIKELEAELASKEQEKVIRRYGRQRPDGKWKFEESRILEVIFTMLHQDTRIGPTGIDRFRIVGFGAESPNIIKSPFLEIGTRSGFPFLKDFLKTLQKVKVEELASDTTLLSFFEQRVHLGELGFHRMLNLPEGETKTDIQNVDTYQSRSEVIGNLLSFRNMDTPNLDPLFYKSIEGLHHDISTNTAIPEDGTPRYPSNYRKIETVLYIDFGYSTPGSNLIKYGRMHETWVLEIRRDPNYKGTIDLSRSGTQVSNRGWTIHKFVRKRPLFEESVNGQAMGQKDDNMNIDIDPLISLRQHIAGSQQPIDPTVFNRNLGLQWQPIVSKGRKKLHSKEGKRIPSPDMLEDIQPALDAYSQFPDPETDPETDVALPEDEIVASITDALELLEELKSQANDPKAIRSLEMLEALLSSPLASLQGKANRAHDIL
ncbi:hypothetical protein BJ508DRAFT_329397 [Ascobolus immersus RN42]|uniref:Uncharacterized protein n=1 Tax=Ascobolus immersus RN42 TaxID=1160509 RepID=A0A3N4I2E1_ASCIM|nr:hypothetical protein BJ508DRAFT_329397 [Ascobolus immersus RN42]